MSSITGLSCTRNCAFASAAAATARRRTGCFGPGTHPRACCSNQGTDSLSSFFLFLSLFCLRSWWWTYRLRFQSEAEKLSRGRIRVGALFGGVSRMPQIDMLHRGTCSFISFWFCFSLFAFLCPYDVRSVSFSRPCLLIGRIWGCRCRAGDCHARPFDRYGDCGLHIAQPHLIPRNG